MKNFVNAKILLIGILILAAVLRFWNLSNVPPTASMDEASIGYNAYSVLKTGKDEYGEFPLISQRGYDDWRRSTYLFLTIPFVAALNLQVVAVRLPATILSIITIWAVYNIVLYIFAKRSSQAILTALTSSLFLAISPWHAYISRLGHESNAYLSFFVFGLLAFLFFFQRKKNIFVSIVFFTLSMISYYAGQVFIPVFIAGLIVIYRDQLKSLVISNKKSLLTVVVCSLALIPLVLFIFSPANLIRYQGTSTFDFSQKKIVNAKIFVNNYISHFKPTWLFTNSGNESFKVPNMGLVYTWELPLVLLGIFSLVRSKIEGNSKKLLFLWLLLSPLPAAIATQAPHAMRSYALAPVLSILAGFGFTYVLTRLTRIKNLTFILLCILVIVSLKSFYINYFGIFPKEQSKSFHYALSKAIPFVLVNQNRYERIVFSNRDNLYQSYMVFLYYSRFDTLTYQNLGGTGSGGFAETHHFSKYEFRPIQWEADKHLQKTLFIGNPSEFSDGANVIQQFRYLDGVVGVIAVQT